MGSQSWEEQKGMFAFSHSITEKLKFREAEGLSVRKTRSR